MVLKKKEFEVWSTLNLFRIWSSGRLSWIR